MPSDLARDRAPYASETILAVDVTQSTDQWQTQLNANTFVLGPSGSGKTRGHLMPNMLQMGSSFLTIDVKGDLYAALGPILANHGYRVECIDFSDPARSTVGYDPLALVRRRGSRPNQLDILSVANAICPNEFGDDPYWSISSANMLATCIAYALEMLPEDERNLAAALTLAERMQSEEVKTLFSQLEEIAPASMAFSMYRRVTANVQAEKMYASTVGVLLGHIMPFVQDDVLDLFARHDRVDVTALGRERTAVFVVVDDLDHTLSPIAGLFVSQTIQALFDLAHDSPGGRLPVPVRVMLDDFANLGLKDIESVLSVSRSRELWVTIICQTVTQLKALYGNDAALSIMGNCDTQVLLAAQDYETATYFSVYADKSPGTILRTPLDKAWLFVRGQRARLAPKFDVTMHPRYQEMLEAQATAQGLRG